MSLDLEGSLHIFAAVAIIFVTVDRQDVFWSKTGTLFGVVSVA